MGLYEELGMEEAPPANPDSCISGSLGPAGDDRSSLKGDSRIPESGDPEGEEEEAAARRAGGGDLDLACLRRRDFSAPGADCCCLACCRHLARRFLNHTCTEPIFLDDFMAIYPRVRSFSRKSRAFSGKSRAFSTQFE
jgi:hypothetical protein